MLKANVQTIAGFVFYSSRLNKSSLRQEIVTYHTQPVKHIYQRLEPHSLLCSMKALVSLIRSRQLISKFNLVRDAGMTLLLDDLVAAFVSITLKNSDHLHTSLSSTYRTDHYTKASQSRLFSFARFLETPKKKQQHGLYLHRHDTAASHPSRHHR